MRDALAGLASGEAYQPLRTIIKPGNAAGLMGLMPAFMSGSNPALGLKAISVFHGNASIGKDIHQGVVLLLSPETGELLSIMNASAITAIRTAAVSGVATDLLAREDASRLAIIGAGVQARSHLSSMSLVRSIKECRIASRNFDNARAFADEMRDLYPFPIVAAKSVASAVDNADMIVTATTSSEPVIKREWLSPGAHLNAVGSSTPAAREVDSATMGIACLFVDRRESAINEAGDYLIPLQEGAIGPDHIRAEIGELLTGEKAGRTSPDEVTLFKSLGLAVEDVAAADHLYRKAKEVDAGTWVEF